MSTEFKRSAGIGVRLKRLVSLPLCWVGLHDLCATGRHGLYIVELKCSHCGEYAMGHSECMEIVMTGKIPASIFNDCEAAKANARITDASPETNNNQEISK